MTEDISLLPLSLAGSRVSVRTKYGGKSHHGQLIIVDYYKKPGSRLQIEWKDKKTGAHQFANTVSDFIIGLGGKPGTPTYSFKINWIPFPRTEYFTNEKSILLALSHMFIRKGYESIKRRQHRSMEKQDIILERLHALTLRVAELKVKQSLGLTYNPEKVFPGLPKDAFQMEHMPDDNKWVKDDETEDYYKKNQEG